MINVDPIIKYLQGIFTLPIIIVLLSLTLILEAIVFLFDYQLGIFDKEYWRKRTELR
jgi:hypothetical protein